MPTGDLTLQEAADHLGVHYMTAYRYVKLGLLYAEKQRGSWIITAEDLAAFEHQPIGEAPDNLSIEDALIAGDETRAWKIVEAALRSDGAPVDIHLDLLSPALTSIGARWARGDLSIASEHKASAVATRIIARLGSHMTSPGRRRGTVIVAAAPGDVHSIPSAMFADLLRACGVEVVDLGGSPDIESLVEAVRRHSDCAVAISVTGPGHDEAVRQSIGALRDVVSDLPIAVGGGAIESKAHATELGADLWHADSQEAARLIAAAATDRRHGSPS